MGIFGGIFLIDYLWGRRQREGIISNVWLFYVLQLLLFGIVGLGLFIFRRFSKVSGRPTLFYMLCGVATACNAAIGAYYLWTGDPAYPSTALWLALGATGCVAFLILTDVFF